MNTNTLTRFLLPVLLLIGFIPPVVGNAAEFGSLRLRGKGFVEISDFHFPAEGCVSLMVKVNDRDNNRCLLSFSPGPEQSVTLAFGLTHLLFTIRDGEQIDFSGIPKEDIPVNEWLALTVTFTQEKIWFFVNGYSKTPVQVGTAFSNPFPESGTLFIGASQEGKDLLRGDIASVLILDNPFYTDDFTLFPLSDPAESGVLLDIRSGVSGEMEDLGPDKHPLLHNGTVDLNSTDKNELPEFD